MRPPRVHVGVEARDERGRVEVERGTQSDERLHARVHLPSLDLADVRPVHPGQHAQVLEGQLSLVAGGTQPLAEDRRGFRMCRHHTMTTDLDRRMPECLSPVNSTRMVLSPGFNGIIIQASCQMSR
ncbi:hypothetical protein PLANTIT3_10044 [Plantibacter sp. T3]|nr:hypothetical protein PLANTIT3_10044 [Plantibacter sp. T3]